MWSSMRDKKGAKSARHSSWQMQRHRGETWRNVEQRNVEQRTLMRKWMRKVKYLNKCHTECKSENWDSIPGSRTSGSTTYTYATPRPHLHTLESAIYPIWGRRLTHLWRCTTEGAPSRSWHPRPPGGMADSSIQLNFLSQKQHREENHNNHQNTWFKIQNQDYGG